MSFDRIPIKPSRISLSHTMVRKQLNQFVWQHFARKYYFHPPLLGLMQFYSAVQKKCCCLLLFFFSTDNNIFDSPSQFSNLQQLCVHRLQFFPLPFTFPSLCYARSELFVDVVLRCVRVLD